MYFPRDATEGLGRRRNVAWRWVTRLEGRIRGVADSTNISKKWSKVELSWNVWAMVVSLMRAENYGKRHDD